MGIQGLLPHLKGCSRSIHVRDYKGRKVVVDGYSWLHKGAYTCARELCEGIYTDRFVQFCLSRVELLRQNGLAVTIVLDGGRLPMKAEEEDTRKKSRRENLEKARAHLLAGNVSAAEDCYQKAVGISSNMAKQLIEALKDASIPFIVAPYEADAQMAYLTLIGEAYAVITEDSDLLAYGCERVLYKLDRSGQGEEICLADLPRNTGLSFVGFNHNMFLEMCIMAGCDFLPNLPGIGIKKAHAHLKKLRSFVKVIKSLRFSGVPVPRDYEIRFQMVLWVFRHQRVYCPRRSECVHVRPLPPGGIGAADVDVPAAVPRRAQEQPGATRGTSEGGGPNAAAAVAGAGACLEQHRGSAEGMQGQEAGEEDLLGFLGPMLPPDVAKGIAQGDLQPTTKQPYNLAQIYQGCPLHRMPLGVQRQLSAKPGASTAAASHVMHPLQPQPMGQWRARAQRQPQPPELDVPQQQQQQQDWRRGPQPLGGMASTNHTTPHRPVQHAGKQAGGAGAHPKRHNQCAGSSSSSSCSQGRAQGRGGGRLPGLLAAMQQHQVRHQQQLLEQQAARLQQSSSRAGTAPFVRPSWSRPGASGAADADTAWKGKGPAPCGGREGSASAECVDKDAGAQEGKDAGASGADPGPGAGTSTGEGGAGGNLEGPQNERAGHLHSEGTVAGGPPRRLIPFRMLVATSPTAADRADASGGLARCPVGGAEQVARSGGAEAGSKCARGGAGGARISGLSRSSLGRQPKQQQQQQQLPLRVLSGPSAGSKLGLGRGRAAHGKAGAKVSTPAKKRQRAGDGSPLRHLLKQRQQQQQQGNQFGDFAHKQQPQQRQQQSSPLLPPPQQQQQQQQQKQEAKHVGLPVDMVPASPLPLQVAAVAAAAAAAAAQEPEQQHAPALNSANGTGSAAATPPALAAATAAAAAATSHCAEISDPQPSEEQVTPAAAVRLATPLPGCPSTSDEDMVEPQLQAILQDAEDLPISETSEEAELDALLPQPSSPLPARQQHLPQPGPPPLQPLQQRGRGQHKPGQQAQAQDRQERAPLHDISNVAAVHAAPAAAGHGFRGEAEKATVHPRRMRPLPAWSALAFRPCASGSQPLEALGGSQHSQQTSSCDPSAIAACAAGVPNHHPSINSAPRQHHYLHPFYQQLRQDPHMPTRPQLMLPPHMAGDTLPGGVMGGANALVGDSSSWEGAAGGDGSCERPRAGAGNRRSLLSDSSMESVEGIGRAWGETAQQRALLQGGVLGPQDLEAGAITSDSEDEQQRVLLQALPLGAWRSSKRQRLHAAPLAEQVFGPYVLQPMCVPEQQQQQQQKCESPPEQESCVQPEEWCHAAVGAMDNPDGGLDPAPGSGISERSKPGSETEARQQGGRGSSSSGGFHSVGYVKQYGEVAARAIDDVMGEGGRARGAGAAAPEAGCAEGAAAGLSQDMPCFGAASQKEGLGWGPDGLPLPPPLQDAVPDQELHLGGTLQGHPQQQHEQHGHRPLNRGTILPHITPAPCNRAQTGPPLPGPPSQPRPPPPVHVRHNPFSSLMLDAPSQTRATAKRQQQPQQQDASPMQAPRQLAKKAGNVLGLTKGGGVRAKGKGAATPQHAPGPSVFVVHTCGGKPGTRAQKGDARAPLKQALSAPGMHQGQGELQVGRGGRRLDSFRLAQ